MHYCMYCNTQASESFLSPHIGRFLWFCHLVWSKTVVSPSVYTSLQWRKNETHIISMAPSLGISQGCKSILKQSNLRGVFFTFSFCNTWIIKKRLLMWKIDTQTQPNWGTPYPSQVILGELKIGPILTPPKSSSDREPLWNPILSASPGSWKDSDTHWTTEGCAVSHPVCSFDSLTLCSIGKSSIYTQEVECRRLIECSNSTLFSNT